MDVSKLPLPVPRPVDFVKDVYPIFKESCISCHGPEKQKGKYRMDTWEGAFKDTDYGPTIVPGKSEQSSIIHMVANQVDDADASAERQAGAVEPLTREQIGILRAWIDQGAKWPDGPVDVEKPVTFAADIQPVFAAACGSCHGADSPQGRVQCTDPALGDEGGRQLWSHCDSRRREEEFHHHHPFRSGRRPASARKAQADPEAGGLGEAMDRPGGEVAFRRRDPTDVPPR